MCVSSTCGAFSWPLAARSRASAATSLFWSIAPGTGSSPLVGVFDEPPQRRAVEQLDGAALHLQQAVTLESREQPAHGFQLEPEIAADLLARHAQHEFARRIAAIAITIGEIQQ